jgi:RNA polymerase sigma-70 factor (ECF subfamily)
VRHIIERAQGGDADAFTAAVERSIDHLYATAYLVLRDRFAAEDAVQDGLLRAWRGIPGLRDPDRFDGWLRRIVVRAAIDSARRTKPTVDVAFEPADPVRTDDAVANRDLLERAFARLAPLHRAILVLRYYLDLSVPDIARTLDVPEGTVKSRLHNAAKAMRSTLGEVDAPDQEGNRP